MRHSASVHRIASFGFALVLPLLSLVPAVAWAKHAPTAAADAQVLSVRSPDLHEIESSSPVQATDGIQRRFGTDSGVLRRLWRMTPSAAKLATQSPRATAEAFLRDNASLLGLEPGRLQDELVLSSEKASPSGTHLRWNQVVNGVPVYRAEIVVKVSNGGEVSSVHNNLRAIGAVSTVPAFDNARAIAIGTAAIRPTGRDLGPKTAELSVVEFESGPRLAYLVSVPVESPMGDWQVFVDARTAEVLGLEDRMVYATGTGRVFDPDPESKTGITNLPDNNDADSGIPFPGAYDIRTLNDITNTAGTYSLSGPYAKIIEFESPVVTPVTATDPDSFRFQRSAQGFEDVMVYFQLDNFQRYIQGLGFTNVNNRIQEADTHGLSGADNSHYIPSSKRLAFGEGGVDDAEDADVVIHEYGHSIQDNIVPGWGGGQEGQMGEGFGDYVAATYSRALYPTHEPNFVFNWDGHNEFWPGRLIIDTSMHYPENCCGEVHDSGTLWCSGLFDAWSAVGKTVMDKIVIDHHFALGTSATMADAANQVIQSDIDLYGGAHVGQLVNVFDTWGFVNAEDFLPVITHTPLTDTENTTGPYVVTAVITSARPLNLSSLKVFFGTTGSFTDSLPLTATGNPNEYSASIPGPLNNVNVRYYLVARDSTGGTSTHPTGAPGSYHQFHVGADVVAPVITHTPLNNFPRIQWPATVSATVTDNIAVNPDSVRVNWSRNGSSRQPFYLVRVGATNVWSGPFPSDTTQVAIGDTIRYRITARDMAATPNVTTHPASGDHAFVIIGSRGTVLVLDDDELPKRETTKVLSRAEAGKATPLLIEDQAPAPGPAGQSAADIASILNGLGFTSSVEGAGTSNPATWTSFGLVISASGSNTGPVANATYRSALESYVAGGGKLLVEGGEVVYDAASSPGYPTFASNVLHSTDWDSDNAGTLHLLNGQTAHPIVRTPNTLPADLPISYTSFGNEDSYKPLAPAYIVYGVTAQPGNGGILVYDNTPSPQNAQIVVLGFDIKRLSDLATRTKLLENTVEYLLRPEGPANGSISGRIFLAGTSNYAGTTLQALPGGASLVTDSTGHYVLTGLYAMSYDLTASHAGYKSSQRAGVVVGQATTTSDVNFILYPRQETADCLSPGTAIPDNNPTGITSVLNVVPAFAVNAVEVSVNIPHTYIGDLIVELRHGVKTVRLHNRTGGSSANLVGTYPTTRSVDGPGTLGDFTGDPSSGTWTLFVSDNAGADVGNLAQWCLYLKGAADTNAVVAVTPGGERAAAAWLAPSHPNPVTASRTDLRFALPQRQDASLVLYDVAGRLVRTLVEGRQDAGEHVVRWDGRDQSGRPVPAGIYLYRLKAGSFHATRRLVVIR